MNIEEATQIINSTYSLQLDSRCLINSDENIIGIAEMIKYKRDCEKQINSFIDENFNFSREET